MDNETINQFKKYVKDFKRLIKNGTIFDIVEESYKEPTEKEYNRIIVDGKIASVCDLVVVPNRRLFDNSLNKEIEFKNIKDEKIKKLLSNEEIDWSVYCFKSSFSNFVRSSHLYVRQAFPAETLIDKYEILYKRVFSPDVANLEKIRKLKKEVSWQTDKKGRITEHKEIGFNNFPAEIKNAYNSTKSKRKELKKEADFGITEIELKDLSSQDTKAKFLVTLFADTLRMEKGGRIKLQYNEDGEIVSWLDSSNEIPDEFARELLEGKYRMKIEPIVRTE